MSNDFLSYAGGAALNLLVALIIVRFIYYRAAQGKGYILLFLMFNTVIYFVMTMLNSIALSLGVGFGLFAVFSVLRYRTEDIPIREITYLFVMIALPLINSALPSGEAFAKIALANVATVVVLYVLEREWGFHFEASKQLTYEVIDFIKPQNRALLLQDLQNRTGLPVKRVDIAGIDFLRDTAQLQIYYDEPAQLRMYHEEQDSLDSGSDVDSDEAAIGRRNIRPVSSDVGSGEVALGSQNARAVSSEVGGDEVAVGSRNTKTVSSEVGSNNSAVDRMLRTIGIITLAAIGCVVGGVGGFLVGLSGLLTGHH